MRNMKSISNNGDFQSLMNCFPSNQQNFDYLVRLMHRHVVVPFVGAGFSANFGYPTWIKFLIEQSDIHNLEEIKTATTNFEYEKAATLLENYLGRSIEYTIIQTFGDHIYKNQCNDTELDNFPKIFRNLILTTNFDEVVEMLYAKVNGEHIDKITPRSMQDVNLCHKRIASGEPTLIKLHGDVASREFILTEHAYDKVYGKRILDVRLPLPSFLRDILLSKVILFIGCSLEDDRTLQVIEQSQIDGSISFALLELPKITENTEGNPWKPKLTKQINNVEVEDPLFAERKVFLNAHNIIPIWFPYKMYDALKIFLKELASRFNSEYTFSVTQAKSQVNNLLYEGKELSHNNKIDQAFVRYASAWEIIKANSEAFVGTNRLDIMKQIESFYNLNGYTFECKEIAKEITDLTNKIYSEDSINFAMRYHELGYAYEQYQYDTLMLKAMQRSKEILQKYEEKFGKDSAFFNAAAFIYISLAYAFLKNGNEQKAKEQYQAAEDLLVHKNVLKDRNKAFIYNGLYRYYELLCDNAKAQNTLEEALRLRKGIYYNENLTDNEIRGIMQHIVNTHSNKIHIYLKNGQYEEAEHEFQICKNEYAICWDRVEYMRDAKRRILTDHGDILMSKGKTKIDFEAAYNEYKEALQYRKYLHLIDDYFAAKIYLKIAECLTNIPERFEEAMEYAIQAYVIYEKTFGTESLEVRNIRKSHIDRLRKCLSYDNKTIEQRILAQQEFFKYRHDERMDNRQGELIRFFKL